MDNLTKQLAKELPHISIDDAKKIVKLYNAAYYHLKNKIPICSICYSKIDPDYYYQTVREDHYLTCCKDHEQYIHSFNVELIRRNLGIKYEDIQHLQLDVFNF